jgi:hypothetical protein
MFPRGLCGGVLSTFANVGETVSEAILIDVNERFEPKNPKDGTVVRNKIREFDGEVTKFANNNEYKFAVLTMFVFSLFNFLLWLNEK